MKSTDNKDYNEIDLNEIPQKVGNFFTIFSNKMNVFFVFLLKKAKFLIPLFIIGFVFGFYLDTKIATFKHEVIVVPNFESTDYLYSKIELINSKIKLKDTAFFEQIQLDKELRIKNLEINPIVDPFSLIDEKEDYIDLVKLLLDGSDMDKLFASETMIRKFKTHKIEIISKNKIDSDDLIVENILKFLNQNEYFIQKQSQEISNLENSITEYSLMNEQANTILTNINNRNSNTEKNDNISINNEYISYNEVLKVKEEMLESKNEMTLKMILFDKTIKDIQISKNLVDKKYLKGYSKFILPFLFIFIFIFSTRVSKFLKNYSEMKTETK